jgi:hypothetical protein
MLCFALAHLPPTAMQGVDLFIFNHDATRIKEVQGEPAALELRWSIGGGSQQTSNF